MRKVTEKFIGEMKDLTNEMFKKSMDSDAILCMNSDDFTMVQTLLKLQETSNEMMLKQAEIIDSLDERVDSLLRMNQQLLIKAGAEGL